MKKVLLTLAFSLSFLSSAHAKDSSAQRFIHLSQNWEAKVVKAIHDGSVRPYGSGPVKQELEEELARLLENYQRFGRAKAIDELTESGDQAGLIYVETFLQCMQDKKWAMSGMPDATSPAVLVPCAEQLSQTGGY